MPRVVNVIGIAGAVARGDPVDLKTIGKLMEELAELQAALSRCVVQGIDEVHPVTSKLNRTWVEEELSDVRASVELFMERFKVYTDYDRVQRKKKQLRAWHEMA